MGSLSSAANEGSSARKRRGFCYSARQWHDRHQRFGDRRSDGMDYSMNGK